MSWPGETRFGGNSTWKLLPCYFLFLWLISVPLNSDEVRRHGGWEQSIKVSDTSGYAWSPEGWLETAGVAGKDAGKLAKAKKNGLS